MFGIFRFYLALCVVLAHIAHSAGPAAVYAVYIFYMLSGYLMTLVCNKKYGFTPKGFLVFISTRILRIHVPYWIICILSISIILTYPNATDFQGAMIIPNELSGIFKNLTLIGLSHNDESRLVAPAWALTVELAFYVLIGLGLAKKRMTIPWLVISILYHILAIKFNWDRYYSLFSASLPFACGAFIYHYKIELLESISSLKLNTPYIFVLLHAIYIVVGTLLFGKAMMVNHLPFYGNIAFGFIAIYFLKHRSDKRSGLEGRLDFHMGGLSYPIYLCHYYVAFFFYNHLNIEKSLKLFFVSILPIILFALLLHIFNEAILERLRDRVKATHLNRIRNRKV